MFSEIGKEEATEEGLLSQGGDQTSSDQGQNKPLQPPAEDRQDVRLGLQAERGEEERPKEVDDEGDEEQSTGQEQISGVEGAETEVSPTPTMASYDY